VLAQRIERHRPGKVPDIVTPHIEAALPFLDSAGMRNCHAYRCEAIRRNQTGRLQRQSDVGAPAMTHVNGAGARKTLRCIIISRDVGWDES
jgi:hypothetical protein